jgi:cyclopropane fatty-acyl-phospholipid synthase-like methyltransferase
MKDRHGALTPHFTDVQSHYDLSDDFFRLFLDGTRPTAVHTLSATT